MHKRDQHSDVEALGHAVTYLYEARDAEDEITACVYRAL